MEDVSTGSIKGI